MRGPPVSEILKIKVKPAFRQVVLTKVTPAFVVFSLLLCFSQGIINAVLFSINAEYETVVHAIIDTSNLPKLEIADLKGTLGSLTLQVCNDIPFYGRAKDKCTTVVDPTRDLSSEPFNWREFRRDAVGAVGDGVQLAFSTTVIPRNDIKTLSVVSQSPSTPLDPRNPTLVRLILLNGLEYSLNARCTRTLLYADKVLRNSKREDVVWLALQFWIFGMSFIAIIHNSVPHLVVVLAARVLLSAWSSFALWRSQNNFARFKELYFKAEGTTPCNLDIGFTDYFQDRSYLQIPELILNCAGLLIFAYMSWTLIKAFRETRLMHVGVPPEVLHLHKYFMGLLACLQLGAFTLMATLGLWADELFTLFQATISEHTAIYKALIVITIVLVIPIGVLGWISVKREQRSLMALFLFLLFALLAGWGAMFASQVFRWTFMDWPLLASMNVASLVLIIASMILGIICRVNFNKGLGHYFHVQEVLDSSGFSPGLVSSETNLDIDVKERDLENQRFYIQPARLHLPLTSPHYTPYMKSYVDHGSADDHARSVEVHPSDPTVPTPYMKSYVDHGRADDHARPVEARPSDPTVPTPYLKRYQDSASQDNRDPPFSNEGASSATPVPYMKSYEDFDPASPLPRDPPSPAASHLQLGSPGSQAENEGFGPSEVDLRATGGESSAAPQLRTPVPPQSPPSFVSNEDRDNGPEAATTRLIGMIQQMRAQMDAMEAPPPYRDNSLSLYSS